MMNLCEGKEAEAEVEEKKNESMTEYKKRKLQNNKQKLENLGRAGGVYVPPFKVKFALKRIQISIIQDF